MTTLAPNPTLTGAAAAAAANPTTGGVQANQVLQTGVGSLNFSGGSPTTSPVITSSGAQADLAAKQASFNAMQTNNANQATRVAQEKANADQSKAEQAQVAQTQKNIDTTNAQKQAEIDAKTAALGLASKGSTTTTNTTSPTTTTPSTTPSTATSSQSNIPDNTAIQSGLQTATDQFAQGVSDIQAQKDQLAQQVSGSLNSLLNGTIPLTPAQNSLVSSIQTQLQQNQAAQQVANQAYVGQVSEAAFRAGGEYTNQQMSGQIANAVSYGVSKIAELDNAAAKTMATLEEQFQKDNYDVINKNYDVLTKQLDDKSASLKETYDAVNKQLVDQRNYNLDIAKFAQTNDQNAFDRAFKTEQQIFAEKQGAFDDKIKSATLGLEQAKFAATQNGGGNDIPSTPMTGSGKPDAAAQQQVLTQIASKYGAATASAVKGLADYSRLPSDFSTRNAKGMSRADMISLVQQYDPTYNENNAAARQAYIKGLSDTHPGSVGYQLNSANTAVNHLASYANAASKLPNGPINALNAVDNSVTLNQGVRSQIASVKSDAEGFGTEFAKFLTGNAPDVNSIKEQQKGLDANNSPADIRGNVQSKIDLLSGRLETLSEQYKNTMGRTPDSNLLGTSAVSSLSKLKNEGYKVNIPGVYYTDPAAYVKSDPSAASALKSVVSQYPNLSQADALQLAQYNQEN